MLFLRSLLFAAVFYLWSTVLCIVMTPLFLCPRRWTIWAFRFWARGIIPMLRVCCGIRVELRGKERVPKGAALIAAKHQCMFDVFAQFIWLEDSSFVMRKELMRIPFFGWYAAKAGSIVLDRDGGAGALRKLVKDAGDRLAEPRQVVIFPEGTRVDPGVAGDYLPGVAGLYRDLELTTYPVATNSGVHWPAHGFLRRPGTIIFEYLDPIPAGLKRAEFMRRLKDQIETGSNALLGL